MPPLLFLPWEEACKAQLRNSLVRSRITTFRCVAVKFRIESLIHAFFESIQRDQNKDVFSRKRAEHMGRIIPNLKKPNAEWYQGYLKKYSKYVPTRSVSIAYDNFVVILKYKGPTVGSSAEFVVCFVVNKYKA